MDAHGGGDERRPDETTRGRRSGATPFRREGARLFVEEVDLFDLAEALQGRAAFLASDAALRAAFTARGPCTLPLADLGAPALLSLAAEAGWWAAVASVHELDVALGAGFAPARCVAVGRVKDDGFTMDAVTRAVGAFEVHDADEAANVARIAALLGLPVPHAEGAPPLAPAEAFAGCGGLLASVLRCDGDALWVDAPLPPPSGAAASALLDAFAVTSEEALDVEHAPPAREVDVRGWSRGVVDPPARRAQLSGCPSRGDALALGLPDALVAHPVDPVHPTPDVVLVKGHHWRPLERRPLPAPPPEG